MSIFSAMVSTHRRVFHKLSDIERDDTSQGLAVSLWGEMKAPSTDLSLLGTLRSLTFLHVVLQRLLWPNHKKYPPLRKFSFLTQVCLQQQSGKRSHESEMSSPSEHSKRQPPKHLRRLNWLCWWSPNIQPLYTCQPIQSVDDGVAFMLSPSSVSLLLVRLTVSFRINRSEIIPCHLDKSDIDRLINQAGAESAGIAIAVLASPGRETRTICKQKTGLHVSNKSRSIYTFTVIKIDQSTRVANKTLAQSQDMF